MNKKLYMVWYGIKSIQHKNGIIEKMTVIQESKKIPQNKSFLEKDSFTVVTWFYTQKELSKAWQ